jgi:hypothetical protein
MGQDDERWGTAPPEVHVHITVQYDSVNQYERDQRIMQELDDLKSAVTDLETAETKRSADQLTAINDLEAKITSGAQPADLLALTARIKALNTTVTADDAADVAADVTVNPPVATVPPVTTVPVIPSIDTSTSVTNPDGSVTTTAADGSTSTTPAPPTNSA